MPVDQLAIQALSLPTEVPGSPATSANFSPNTQSSFSALAGSGATPAPMFNDYSTNTTDGNALVGSGSNAVSSDGITGVAVDQVGGNTGGVVGASVEPGDYKAMIPETVDSLEQQEDEFIDTISQGYTATTGVFNKGKTAYGKTAARYARRDDRIDDRADRRAARDKIKAEGGTAKQGRQKKRQMRKADKAERKEAWTSYKGEADLSSREDI